MAETKIGVYTELPGGKPPVRVGTLWAVGDRARQGAKFEYDAAWLAHPQGYGLEPALPLGRGVQYTRHALFGCMADSSPDRWGRTLMKRAEAARAREAAESPRWMSEADYLLRVCDTARQGALRYSLDGGATFLDNRAENAVPPLVDLRKLQHAVDNMVEDKAGDADLQLLLAPGSSLGGAWPKACVRDERGRLCIAKFSRADEESDVVAWEAVALQLARAAGLSVPPFRLETLVAGGRRRHVLVVEKFDRGPAGERIPYLSAMSLLDAEDGDRRSYLELAEAMQPSCVDYRRQLRELWRRMAFNHLVCNTDDHMRNHGFLRLRPGGWELSPLFDVNPTPPSAAPRDRATPLTPEGEAVNRETLLECCTSFHLRLSEAQDAWTRLQNAVAGWRAAASAFRIPKREQDRMADAFTTL